MDSVRFSIIENDLRWEQEQVHNDGHNDDEDDCKSISSESSGEGVPVASTRSVQLHIDTKSCEQEIWQTDEITLSLKQLPHADKLCEIITNDNGGMMGELSSNRSHANTALLLAVWFERTDAVLKLVNIYAADPNTADPQGRGPLHLACAIGNIQIARILIRHGARAHQWDKAGKATPLHCAASSGNVECIQLLLRNGADLNAGIEKRSPLHYAVEKNAIKTVEVLLQYGACPNTPQVFTETPLHIAAALGFGECMRLLLDHGADVRSHFGKRKYTALHLAAEDDYIDCVRMLLDAGAGVDPLNHDHQTPLHLACLSQSVESVELLIRHGASIHARYRDGRTALHASIVKESKCWECARLLLQAGVDVNKADNYGYTPIHVAALNEYSSCVNMLIEYGADITARTNGGISALSFIVRRTPEIIPKFHAKFDSSIKVNENEIGDVDCEIKLDFRLLVPNSERGETELLLAFIEVGQKRILKHPLCETFLFLKWRRIRKFFLFSLFFHAVFVLLFTVYILGVFVEQCPKPCAVAGYVQPIGYLVVLLDTVLLAKELFQMAHGFASYVRYWENWLQWSIITGVYFCATPGALSSGNVWLAPPWQHHVAAVIIFLVWLELMMLVGRFPIFGLYVQMFTKVAVNFSKFLLVYCCLLIAFGLSFSVLFTNYPSFKTVPWALLKTVIMMAGELEFEDIFYGSQPLNYPVTSHGIFFAFVILVTVILTNLLVGLAVSDIQGLQASAGLDRLTRQADLVSRLEGLFFSKLLRRAPQKLLAICQRKALLRTSQCHLQYCIKPNDPREKRLPKELILSIYKLVAERRDRNQSLKRRRAFRKFSPFNRERVSVEPDVQLRNATSSSVSACRFRTFSENPHGMDKNCLSVSSSPIPKDLDATGDAMQRQLNEMTNKIECLQGVVAKKLDDINKELALVKMRLSN